MKHTKSYNIKIKYLGTPPWLESFPLEDHDFLSYPRMQSKVREKS